jgi:hypothetical protein
MATESSSTSATAAANMVSNAEFMGTTDSEVKETIVSIYAMGDWSKLPKAEQLVKLKVVLHFLTRECPTAQKIQLEFSEHEDLLYAGNPYFAVM